MFQRMMVIPQEEYLQLTSTQQTQQLNSVEQVKQPLTQQFYNLESQYKQQGHITDPYRKLVHQSETLDAMKALKEKLRQGIVTATPKPYQSRAQSLLQHLDPILKLNERGEMLDGEGQVIPESRVEDLIQHAVRDRRRNFIPVGWNPFLKTIKDNNIPKYMLNRDTLEELESAVLPKAEIKKEVKIEVQTPKAMKRAASSPTTTPGSQSKRRRSAEEIMQRPQRKRKRPAKYGIDFLSDF